jgi:hypothetical protein
MTELLLMSVVEISILHEQDCVALCSSLQNKNVCSLWFMVVFIVCYTYSCVLTILLVILMSFMFERYISENIDYRSFLR